MQWLHKVCEEFSYPDPTKQELSENYAILQASDKYAAFCDILAQYAQDYQLPFQKVMDTCADIANATGIHPYRMDMLMIVYLLQPLREHMQKAGYKEEFWREVALDIRYKLVECLCLHNICGTFVMSWFGGFFNLTRFGFGKLQFELRKLETDCTVDGIALKAGTTAINMHIPRTGTPLDADSVEKAYRKAAAFYAEEFPEDYVIFMCNSYLLHSSSVSLYKKGSNLEKFTSRFQMLFESNYDSYAQMWRIFDCVIDENHLELLPADSSLRRGFIEHMKAGKPIGHACGVFIRKKNV